MQRKTFEGENIHEFRDFRARTLCVLYPLVPMIGFSISRKFSPRNGHLPREFPYGWIACARMLQVWRVGGHYWPRPLHLLMTFVGFMSIPGSDHVGFPEPADRCGVAGTLPPVQVSQKIIYII